MDGLKPEFPELILTVGVIAGTADSDRYRLSLRCTHRVLPSLPQNNDATGIMCVYTYVYLKN